MCEWVLCWQHASWRVLTCCSYEVIRPLLSGHSLEIALHFFNPLFFKRVLIKNKLGPGLRSSFTYCNATTVLKRSTQSTWKKYSKKCGSSLLDFTVQLQFYVVVVEKHRPYVSYFSILFHSHFDLMAVLEAAAERHRLVPTVLYVMWPRLEWNHQSLPVFTLLSADMDKRCTSVSQEKESVKDEKECQSARINRCMKSPADVFILHLLPALCIHLFPLLYPQYFLYLALPRGGWKNADRHLSRRFLASLFSLYSWNIS